MKKQAGVFNFLLFLIWAVTLGCSPKTTATLASQIPTLADGFYVVTKTGNFPKELQPISDTEKIIGYHKDFLDPKDDAYLVIETADFVPLSLKEKPTTEVQADQTQNFYLVLNDLAKSKLEQFTTLNLYKTRAIVVNGEAYTKHKIKTIIHGG